MLRQRPVSLPPKQALTETGSSVIIDMGQPGEPSARTEPIIAPMMSNPDLDELHSRPRGLSSAKNQLYRKPDSSL